jgi:hypothetical protein
MNPILRNFYDNSNEREAVKAFLIDVLKDMAVERVFEKQTISGLYEGRKAIEKAFNRLEELYGRIDAPIKSNSR